MERWGGGEPPLGSKLLPKPILGARDAPPQTRSASADFCQSLSFKSRENSNIWQLFSPSFPVFSIFLELFVQTKDMRFPLRIFRLKNA